MCLVALPEVVVQVQSMEKGLIYRPVCRFNGQAPIMSPEKACAMRISSSNQQWDMSHTESQSTTTVSHLQIWSGRQPGADQREAAQQVPPSVVVNLSPNLGAVNAADEDIESDPRTRLIQSIVEQLTGEKVKTVKASDLRGGRGHPPQHANHGGHRTENANASMPVQVGWGLSYSATTTHTEQAQTQVRVSATVHTVDGQEISVSIGLSMSRSYTEQTSVSLRFGEAVKKDPLVVNFDGHAAELQSEVFAFDLDGDGQTENMAMLGASSGYLALDIDGNGKVDSGKELFGPATGQGFQELAAYDQDGNGWIDEGDTVFRKLQIWKPAEDTLQSAVSMGIGAIGLDVTASPFELRGSTNQSLGAIRSTGMYLMENGRAGTVQQLDLTV